MKVRIEYTVTVTDEQRRAIAAYFGERGIATRNDIKEFFRAYGEGNGVLDDVVDEYRTA